MNEFKTDLDNAATPVGNGKGKAPDSFFKHHEAQAHVINSLSDATNGQIKFKDTFQENYKTKLNSGIGKVDTAINK